MLRGHDTDDDLRGVKRDVQVAGRRNRFRQDESRQEALVDSASCDALRNLRFVRPQADPMRSFASQDDCQAGAPGPCSDDGNAAHLRVAFKVPDSPSGTVTDSAFDFVSNLLPNFNSVPAAIRPMFLRCFQMTSAETRATKISCRGSTYSRRAHTSSGKAAAMPTDASETYRKATATIKNRTV